MRPLRLMAFPRVKADLDKNICIKTEQELL